jgi:RNA polymerase primary sigma factor
MKRDQMTNEQLCALAKQGDADAQNLLIENNLRFIKKTAYEVWNAQAELNRSLQISLDDLVQEGSLGLFGCIESYNPDSGNLFLTYVAPAIRNAMIDYIRSQNVSFEAKHLNDIISLDDPAIDEVRSKHNFIADPTKQMPEQIYLAQERIVDIHHALYMIDDREEQYLRYRFGFDDDMEHPLTETARHFHLSESRAKSTEALALDNVWLELPWWYEQRRTFLLASIIEAWIALAKKIDEMIDE